MRRLFQPAFWIGLGLFLLSLGVAGALYPGGNRFDAREPGYSLTGNFICDLFHRDGYDGRPNPGRPFAELAAYAFATTLLLYWNALPALFANRPKPARLVRILGSTAMGITFFVGTPLHDWCINTAIPLAMLAFFVAIRALGRSGEKGLARLGAASVAICFVNYFLLVFRFFPAALPGMQKVTLVVFVAWIVYGAIRLRRA